MGDFRFEDLDVWKNSIQLANTIFDICDQFDRHHQFRFAEQLRGAALSISNNIAEGSGSTSKREFINFLNFARRSCFEVANMLILFGMRKMIADDLTNNLLKSTNILCRKITNFQKSLMRN